MRHIVIRAVPRGRKTRQLYHCLFEIRLCSAKERGNGRLGRVDTGLLARTLPSGTKEHANTHERCLLLVEPTDRRDALCPSAKIQKHAAFGITSSPYKKRC